MQVDFGCREDLLGLVSYVSIQRSTVQAEAILIVRSLATRSTAFLDVFKASLRYETEVLGFKEGLSWALYDGLRQPMSIEDLGSTGTYPIPFSTHVFDIR